MLKLEATELGFSSIVQKGSVLTFRFESDAVDPQILIGLCQKFVSCLRLSAGLNPYFTLQLTDKEMRNPISRITFLLQSMKELKNSNN